MFWEISARLYDAERDRQRFLIGFGDPFSFAPAMPLPDEEAAYKELELSRYEPQESVASKIGKAIGDVVEVIGRELVVPILKEEVRDELLEATSDKRVSDAVILFFVERGLDKMSDN